MSCYATMQDVIDCGTLPAEDVHILEQKYPGIVLRVAARVSSTFDTRLIKRYTVPFNMPYPPALVDAVARVVAWRLLLIRSFNPGSEQDQLIKEEKDEAMAWLTEAADSEKGNVELPTKSGSTVSAVSAGTPYAYAEASPYMWCDVQRSRIYDGDG